MATTTTTTESIELAPLESPIAQGVSTAPATHDTEPQTVPGRSKLATWAILSALLLSEFIAALDTTITATSVPVICADLK